MRSRRRCLTGLSVLLALFAGCSKQAREERALAQADKDFAADDFARAEVEYRKAMSLYPLDDRPLAQLGILYLQQGRFRIAYGCLKHAIDADPAAASGEAKAALAETEMALGAVGKAHDDAVAAVKTSPGSERAWTMLARSSRTAAQIKEAQSLLADLGRKPEMADIHDLVAAFLQADAAQSQASVAAYLARHPESPAAHGALMTLAARRNDRATALKELHLAAEHAPIHSTWRLLEIDTLARTGSRPEAEKIAIDLTTRAPDFVTAWLARLRLAAADGRYDDALADAREVLSRDPGNFDGMATKAALLLQKGDLKAAIAAYLDALAAYPRVPLLHFELGMAYLRHRDIPLAETQLNLALSLDPNLTRASTVLAEIDLNRNRPAAARLRLVELLKKWPKVPEAYLDLGRACLLEKNYDGALEAYRQMQQAFPRAPDPDYRMGLVYLEKKDRAAARAAFERSVRLAPGADIAHEMLVNLDLADGRVAAARERVQAMLAREPHSASPWLLAAKIDLVGKDHEAAKKDLSQAIAADPNVSESYTLLSRLFVADKQPEAAAAELKAMAERTRTARAYLQYGLFLIGQKKYPEAKAELAQATSIDPQFVPAISALAWLDIEYLRQNAEAEQLARKARELSPEDPATARTLGWVLLKQRQVREGLGLLQEACDGLPTDPDARFRLGVAHYLLGLEDEARADFQRALGENPDPPLKTSMERLISLLNYQPVGPDTAHEAMLAQIVAADPEALPAIKRLALLEDLDGKPQAAAEHYRAILTVNPGNVDLLMRLARLYAGPLHAPAKAIETAKLAHEKAPDDARIALALGRLAAQVGAHAWAVDLLEQADRAQLEDAALPYDLAWEYSEVGRLDRAQEIAAALPENAPSGGHIPVRQFTSILKAAQADDLDPKMIGDAEAAVKADGHFASALLVLGRAKEADASPAEAEALYSRILGECPSFYPARRRLASLLYQKGRYADSADNFRQTQKEGHFSGWETFCFGMSLYHLKDPAAQLQLRQALVLGLPDAESAEARRALKDLSEHAL